MAGSHASPRDTAPDALAIQRRRWADASSVQKVEMIEALCADVGTLARAGLRIRYPDASEREMALRLGALTMPRDLMVEAFGWDSEREGR